MLPAAQHLVHTASKYRNRKFSSDRRLQRPGFCCSGPVHCCIKKGKKWLDNRFQLCQSTHLVLLTPECQPCPPPTWCIHEPFFPLSTNESLADASIVSNLHLRFPLREPCWVCWTMALLWCKNDNGASVSGKSSHKQEVVSCGLFNIFLAATVFSFQRKWTSPRCTNCFELAGDLLGTPLRRPHSDER